MPDSPLSLPPVPAGADRSATIRDAAVTVLAAWPPLAGVLIGRVMIDPLQSGDYPAVNVFLHRVQRSSVSRGAAAPAFDTTATIGLQLLVEQAQKDDAVNALDGLHFNVLNGLLSDPIWPRLDLAKPDGDLPFDIGFKANGEKIIGEGLATIECGPWMEIYDPRVTSPLSTIALTTDLARPFDPTGLYTDDQAAGFPAAATPPRNAGPDGRIELGAIITLPTD